MSENGLRCNRSPISPIYNNIFNQLKHFNLTDYINITKSPLYIMRSFASQLCRLVFAYKNGNKQAWDVAKNWIFIIKFTENC